MDQYNNMVSTCIEVLAIDVKAEGHQKGMDINLLHALTDLGLPMLAFED